jgi:tetratricopeptide (TPR) repeat protein
MRTMCFGVLSLTILCAVSCSTDPEIAKRKYVASGDRYVADKKYADAVIQYRNAVTQDASFGEARFKLAQAYFEVGNTADALRQAVRAADLLPKDVAAQLLAGKLLLAQRRVPEAKARALNVLLLEPKNVEGLLLLGNSLAGLKDLDGAIERVEEAIDQDPRSSFAYTNLSFLQTAKGDAGAAEQALKRAVEVNPASVPAHLSLANFYWAGGRKSDGEHEMQTALALEPASALTNRAAATFYLASGNKAQAEKYLKTYVGIEPAPVNKLVLADFYLNQTRTSEALPILEGLHKDGFVPATLRLAQIDFQAGRKHEAYERVSAVLKKTPKNEQAIETNARFLISDRKYKEALKLAEDVLRTNPRALPALYIKGLAFEGLWARDQAITAFRELLKIDPTSTPAQLKVAEVSLARGDTKTAMQYLTQVRKTRPTVGAAILFARALIRDGKVAQAEPELTALAKQLPASSDVQAALGSLYLRKNDPVRARQAFNRALELAPNSVDAVAGLTALDVGAKRADAAAARLDQQLAARPDDVKLLEVAANTYLVTKRGKDAEAAFKKIIDLDPNNLSAYSNLALLYVGERRLDEAKKNFEDLAGRSEQPAGPLTMVGMILILQNQPTEARKKFEAALALDSRAAVAANNLAWLYAEGGENLDRALNLAETAKAGLPDNGDVSDTLGWIYYKKGLFDRAVASLRDASRQKPSSPDIQYRLGLAYLGVKNDREARQSLERALKLNPKFAGAEDAKRALASIKS